MEESRAQELEILQMWPKTEKTQKEEKEKKWKAKGWAWGSWWAGKWDWSSDQRGTSGGASTHNPLQGAEPTAGPRAKGDTARWLYPTRSAEEDHMALRHAAISPASFVPQRHITMALGRPVVVFSGSRNVGRGFRSGLCRTGTGLIGKIVSWSGVGWGVVSSHGVGLIDGEGERGVIG